MLFPPTLAKGEVNVTTTSGERTVRRQVPKDLARILGDCRDLAIHRLLLSFTSLLDQLEDLALTEIGRPVHTKDQSHGLDQRAVLEKHRNALLAGFEGEAQ